MSASLARDRRTSLRSRSKFLSTGSDRKVLVIDVGGTSVKLLATGQRSRRSFPSGLRMTPEQMVTRTKKLVSDWLYTAISIGYPGPVLRGRPIAEPYNLGRGWVGFDFGATFGFPTKVF